MKNLKAVVPAVFVCNFIVYEHKLNLRCIASYLERLISYTQLTISWISLDSYNLVQCHVNI